MILEMRKPNLSHGNFKTAENAVSTETIQMTPCPDLEIFFLNDTHILRDCFDFK